MNLLLILYRFLQGYIQIEISSGFTERFLNLCNRNGITIWNTSFSDKKIITSIYCKDFFRLKGLKKKTGVKIKILSRHGLTFLIKQNRNRSVLIYGVAISLLLMFVLNQFIWCIEINNTENTSKEEILKAVNQFCFSIGEFKGSFDKSTADRRLINCFDGKLSWATINLKGSKAVIEALDHTNPPDINDADNEPCNIIADFDGIIVSSEVFSGVLSKAAGNGVKKGDLLISGISENADGTASFIKAQGRITAIHKIEKFESYNNDFKSDILIENNRYNELIFFGIEIPMSFESLKKNTNKEEYTMLLKINNSFLPFGSNVITEYENKQNSSNHNKLIYYADDFTSNEYNLFQNTLIINTDYSISPTQNGYDIFCEYLCIDFIGKKQVILQEN